MKVKVLKTGVTVENAILDVGAVVDMSEKDATRLSGYGLVEVVDEPEPRTGTRAGTGNTYRRSAGA